MISEFFDVKNQRRGIDRRCYESSAVLCARFWRVYNASPAFKYFPVFSGAGEVSDKYIYRNTSPATEKYLNTQQ